MKNIIRVILLTIYWLPISAQEYNNITGNIIDENSTPLANVTITLSGLDSTFIKGTTTNSIGFSTFCDQIELKGKDKIMPDIILKPSNILLKEVEVKGKTFIRKEGHKADPSHNYPRYECIYV